MKRDFKSSAIYSETAPAFSDELQATDTCDFDEYYSEEAIKARAERRKQDDNFIRKIWLSNAISVLAIVISIASMTIVKNKRKDAQSKKPATSQKTQYRNHESGKRDKKRGLNSEYAPFILFRLVQ